MSAIIDDGTEVAILKQYVIMHGGTIIVSDNKPQGTVFFIKTSFYLAAKLIILYFMAKQKAPFAIKLNFT